MNFDPFWAVNQNSDALWADHPYRFSSLMIILFRCQVLEDSNPYTCRCHTSGFTLWFEKPLAVLSTSWRIEEGYSSKSCFIFFYILLFFLSYPWFVNWSKKIFLSSLTNEHEWRVTFSCFAIFLPSKYAICSDTSPYESSPRPNRHKWPLNLPSSCHITPNYGNDIFQYLIIMSTGGLSINNAKRLTIIKFHSSDSQMLEIFFKRFLIECKEDIIYPPEVSPMVSFYLRTIS